MTTAAPGQVAVFVAPSVTPIVGMKVPAVDGVPVMVQVVPVTELQPERPVGRPLEDQVRVLPPQLLAVIVIVLPLMTSDAV